MTDQDSLSPTNSPKPTSSVDLPTDFDIGIRVAAPYLSEESKDLAQVALQGRSPWLSPGGVFHTSFRDELKDFLLAEGVTLVNSGTSALEVAIRSAAKAAGVVNTVFDPDESVRGFDYQGPYHRPEIILPSYTCPDCAIAVVKAGFRPVFADVDPTRQVITGKTLADAISSATSAVGVMFVHLWGMTPPASAYMLARSHGLFIVDDCAESLGSRPDGYDLMSLTDVAATSFRGDKPLPIGTGGAVYTPHKSIAGIAEAMVGGLNSPGGFNRLVPIDVPLSYEFPEVLAAIGLGQLHEYEESIDARLKVVAWYKKCGVTIPFQDGDIPWKMPIKVHDPRNAYEVLRLHGVETTPPHLPLYTLGFLRRMLDLSPLEPPHQEMDDIIASSSALAFRALKTAANHAASLYLSHLMFPLHPRMTENDVIKITDQIRIHSLAELKE